MAQITILPPQIVNRIAAGEVIERPASVVKELLENAIDAGASEILIDVEDGGRRQIRVRDNGSGISPEDLPLAFQSHATSKLPLSSRGESGGEEPDGSGLELFNLETLGFRGEALASIASIAEVEAVSRLPESDCAYRYRIRGRFSLGEEEGGKGPEPVAAPFGTSIEVRNLFFNTPARRKFLRSSATELSHIVEQVVRLALGFPGIRFVLTGGAKRILECPAASGLRERLAAVLGRERAGELIEVRESPDSPPGVKVRGFIGPPHLHRADTRGQQFFVDGRWVRDRVLGHAIQEAYQGFLISGQKPLVYLFVDLPRGAVDVNVHPTKSEVRFLDSSSVHRAAFGAVRAALEERGGPAKETGGEFRSSRGTTTAPKDSPQADALRERVRAATLDFFSSGPRERDRGFPGVPRGGAAEQVSGGTAERTRESPLAPREDGERIQPAFRTFIQVLQSYILVEMGDRLVVFDQHALHEKILYERILAGLREGAMPRQRLLIPEVVELPLELVPLMVEVKNRLEPLGFEVEPFGSKELAVHAIPAILDEAPAGPVVIGVARWLQEAGAGGADPSSDGSSTSPPDPLGVEVQRLAQLIACKQAVKAGMPLSEEEIHALLESASDALDPRFCPHGRPTSVEISRAELDRRFQRK